MPSGPSSRPTPEVLKPPKDMPVYRMVFHEITAPAIREAFANPRELDQLLVDAQETRRLLDRLAGYDLSQVLWKKVNRGLSAGRVQSVAVRLVVDTGMHSKGWTEQQGIEYFKEKTPVAEGAVTSEVRRYLVWPGQATAYKIGMLKILEIRAKAKEQLGDKFDIKAFHDLVLLGGAVPMSVLDTKVKNWVAAQKV